MIRVEALHRANVHAAERGEEHQLAQRDVRLPRTPFLDDGVARSVDHVALDDLAEAVFEVFHVGAAHLADAFEVTVHVGVGDIGARGEDDEVRAIGDLRLAVERRA